MSIKKAIALQFISPNGDTYFCSRPMTQTIDIKNNKFIFQILRNVDLGFISSIGEEIIVNVLLYPTNLKYSNIFTINANNNLIYNSSIVKSLGKYIIPINIIEEENIFNTKKGYVKQVLIENPELKISLRSIYHIDIDSYEITHPNIEGDLSFLE
jgi:hypothetical protein